MSDVGLNDTPSSLPVTPGGRGAIARSAGVIGVGNITSRLLGLVRESVIAAVFGTGELANAFKVAASVPTLIYDMLIGGLLSSALVPVFSGYAERGDRNDLWRLASLFVTLAVVVLSIIAALVALLAPQIAALLVSGYSAEQQALVAQLIRVVSPSIIFFGISGSLTGLLYALKRFNFAAFAAAIYNVGVIIGAVLLSRAFEGQGRVIGLTLGVVLGSLMQLTLLLPDLRDIPLRARLGPFWRDAGIRRIVKLFLPIALSVVVAAIGTIIDRNLASNTEATQTIAWMDYATRLIQLPLGLVAAAVSLAVLPDLSRAVARVDEGGYRSTLQLGLRMVLVLIIPATVGLFVLAEPIVGLLYERGVFNPADTEIVAAALRLYLIGLSFAAIDQVLIISFYARQDTLTPALVGIAAIGVYLLVALPLLQPLQMFGLILANDAQHFSHAVVMLVLLQWRYRALTGGMFRTLIPRLVVASALMGLAVWGALLLMPTDATFLGRVLVVVVPGVVGLGVYSAAVILFRIEEAQHLANLLMRKLRR